MNKFQRYLLNWLIWIDLGVNTLRGGDPHETISSVAGKAQQKGERWACVLCRLLNMIQANHCANSIMPGVGAEAIVPDAIAPTGVDGNA